MLSKKSKTKFNINDTLNFVETSFTTYENNISSTYKMLSPNNKSTQLTMSTQFHNVLNKIREGNKDCKVLNTLAASEKLKVKNSYLADNHINALNTSMDANGDPLLDYLDIKKVIQKDLAALRIYPQKEDFIVDLKALNTRIKNIELIYDTSKATKKKKEALLTKKDVKDGSIYKELYYTMNTFQTIYNKLVLDPNKILNADASSILLTYLSSIPEITNFVITIGESVSDFIRSMQCIHEDDTWFDSAVPSHKDVKKHITETLNKNDVIYKAIKAVIYYYEELTKNLIDFLEFTYKFSSHSDEVLAKLKALKANNMLNMLVCTESMLNFVKDLHTVHDFGLFHTRYSTKSILRILRDEDIIPYGIIIFTNKLKLDNVFPGLGSGIFNSSGILNNSLHKEYKNYLKSLFKSPFRESCKLGKISSKLFNSHYTAVEIEIFVNLFRKQLITNTTEHDIRIVEGPLVSYYYNELSYHRPKRNSYQNFMGDLDVRATRTTTNSTADTTTIDLDQITRASNACGGSLGMSCMRYAQRLERTKFYADNPTIFKLLVALDTDKHVNARAVLEYNEDGSVYIDRVYAANEKVRLEVFAWAEQRGFISINNTNGSYKSNLKYTKKEPLICVLDKPIERDFLPYLDSIKVQSKHGVIANKTLEHSKKIEVINKTISKRIENKLGLKVNLLSVEDEKYYECVEPRSFGLENNVNVNFNTELTTIHHPEEGVTNPIWHSFEKIPAWDEHILKLSFKKKNLGNTLTLNTKPKFNIAKQRTGRYLEDLFESRLNARLLAGRRAA